MLILAFFVKKIAFYDPFQKYPPKGAKIDRLVKYLSIHKNLGHNVHRKTKDGNLGWILIFSGHANSYLKMPIYGHIYTLDKSGKSEIGR